MGTLSESFALARAQTHELMIEDSNTQLIIGTSQKDRIYPKKKIKKFLQDKDIKPHVIFVDLDWDDHMLGSNFKKRYTRVFSIGEKMRQARIKASN